ncbi:unnamed protein product [Brachionus calyciflorus]|uniref:Barrier-to-autointegration factor n=1 Tax=Brachionus calyciflorus TaxID=104777 RepID=A0A814B6U9_9BILA|nr:unnamed protein product [Brachionus calyciflorus]
MTTPQKNNKNILPNFDNFSELDVSEINGIGNINGKILKEKGYSSTGSLLGKFLVLKKDKERFTQWLISCGIDVNNANQCFQFIKDWTDMSI